MKRLFLAIAALLTGMGLSAQLRFGNSQAGKSVHDELEQNMQKLVMSAVMINNYYVDSVDSKKLVEDAIQGILSKLDPHSAYTNASDTKKFTEPLEGSFEGIGVQFNMLEDTLLVIQPVPKGPSERVGILAGDRIISVADTAIAGVKMSREEIMHRLRGKKGTIAHLGIIRRGIRDTLYFDVKRDRIPVNSVDAAYMVTPTIGLVRFNNFAQTTHDEVVQAIRKLKQQGMTDLIIDLQQNSGGFLQAAADIASEFLPKGDMIVYTKGRSVPSQEFRSSGGGCFQEGRVAVLIDEYSASAAEILSGAIQDQDRGIVVGRRTFGKGLVQRPIDLPDGSMIRLTGAHYYTPSGRCIQKPYVKGDAKKYYNDIEQRYKHGEFTNADSIHFADSLRFETLKKHRAVYGGGGIMPDYFIPLDTTRYTKYHRELSAKSVVLNANLRYAEKNRSKLWKLYGKEPNPKDANKGFKAFEAGYTVPQSFIDEIYEEGRKAGIEPKDEAEAAQTTVDLRRQLKALVARDLWSMTEYFRVSNEDNDAVKCAIKQLVTD